MSVEQIHVKIVYRLQNKVHVYAVRVFEISRILHNLTKPTLEYTSVVWDCSGRHIDKSSQ